MATHTISHHLHTMSTHTPTQDLQLFRNTWTRAVRLLQQEKAALLESISAGESTKKSASPRLSDIDHKIAVYEMCIDRANEREEMITDRPNLHREAERERYFRLIASMAAAENDQADRNDRLDFVGAGAVEEDGWSASRWSLELEHVANEARRQMTS